MKYQRLYVYGFAHAATGRNLELIMPSANVDCMEAALDEFARWADPDDSKILLLVVDNAGWHVAKRLKIPPNVVPHRPPPCTPELQPVESLRPLLREAVANKGFPDLPSLESAVVDRCRWLIDHPEIVKGRVGFGWMAAIG